MFASDRPWVDASRMFETKGFLYERLFIAGNMRHAVLLVAHLSRCGIEMDSDTLTEGSRAVRRIFSLLSFVK